MTEQVLVSKKFLEETCPNINWDLALEIFPIETKEKLIRKFVKQTLHGDDLHREWLIQAGEDFIAGRPINLEATKE